MFVAAVIRLRLAEDAPIPPYLGRSVHGAFFKLLASADATTARSLHEDTGRRAKPFTVSNLLGLSSSPGLNSTSFRAGQPCFIRITSIASQLSDVLLTRLLPNLPDRLNIENRQFIVDGFATSGADHPLAGTTEPAKLAARYMLEGSTPPNQITLSFASPTLFHSSGRNVILPFPAFVFGSYFDRWNANADSPLGADVRRFAEESVEISAFRMSTDQVQLNRGSSVTGFTGTCQFRAQNHEQSWLRVLHLLAAFSFWCGTGYKTTMGLGQTQPLTLSAGRRDN